MRRRKQNKKQIQLIIGISMCLLLIMTAGYAAFSTNLNITAKGNIKNITASKQLKQKVVSTGEGLYRDITENERYIYRGDNPNNYITFNNELWKIISVETDGTLKIIGKALSSLMPFDERTSTTDGPRNNPNNTYCQRIISGEYKGCNIYGNVSGIFTNGIISGTVTTNSTINTYLNTTYYNELTTEAKSQIISHDYNAGPVRTREKTINDILINEKTLKWNGKVGLVNTSDFIKASNNATCHEDIAKYTWWISGGTYGNNYLCAHDNYITKKIPGTAYTINPFSNYSDLTVVLTSTGFVDNNNVAASAHILPTVFLKSDIQLDGTGTESDPYTIK